MYAEWKLTDTAIERIEKLRDGGNRENAVLALGTAVSLAQLILART